MRLRSALVVLSGCALLAGDFAAAQSRPPSASTGAPTRTFHIRGSLRLASTHRGVEMIRVDLKKFTGEVVNTTYTSSNGEFEFAGLSSGNYILEVMEEGFEPIRQSIDVLSTGRTGIFLYLREPLKLEASRASVPAVPARELALTDKAAEALEKGRRELFAKKNPEESIKHFQKLAKEAPDFYEAHYYLGLALADTGRLPEAESELRLAISESQESHAPSYVTLSSLLNDQRRFAEAEPNARQAIALEPAPWLSHFELARSLLGLKRADEAYQSAQTALEKKQDSADLHLLLADICLRRDDAPGLLAAFDAFLALEPEGSMSDRIRAARQRLLEQMEQARATPAPPKQRPPQR